MSINVMSAVSNLYAWSKLAFYPSRMKALEAVSKMMLSLTSEIFPHIFSIPSRLKMGGSDAKHESKQPDSACTAKKTKVCLRNVPVTLLLDTRTKQ